jgi:hypothetical protein
MVPPKRLELSRLAALEPKSSASTNSAKGAIYGAGCRIRTDHLRITSALLYQMS